jgi:hypothetical protein
MYKRLKWFVKQHQVHKACLNIEKVYRRDENYVIQQSVLFTWCCFTNHFRRL